MYLFFVFSQADSWRELTLNKKGLGEFLKIDKETPGKSRRTLKAESFPNNNVLSRSFLPTFLILLVFRFSCFPLSRKYMDVFAGDLRFGVASNELRLPDVGLSVPAKANVPKAEHRAQRSEHGAQLVAAR